MAVQARGERSLFVRHFAFGDVLLTTPFFRLLSQGGESLRTDLYSQIGTVHTSLPGFGDFHFMDHRSLDQVLKDGYAKEYYFHYEFDRSLHILDGYSISTGLYPQDRRLIWTVLGEERERAEALLEEIPRRPLVGFLPLCGNPLKSLSHAKCQEIIDAVTEGLGATVALFADRYLDHHGCVNLTNRFASIRDLAAVIELCDVFITIDTGPFHIAQALGVPTVGLFGCTLPELLATDPSTLQAVQARSLSCLGCYHRVPKGQEVPPDCVRGGRACLEGLSPQEIVKAVVAALERRRDEALQERIDRYEARREEAIGKYAGKTEVISNGYRSHILRMNSNNKELRFRRRWKRKARNLWRGLTRWPALPPR